MFLQIEVQTMIIFEAPYLMRFKIVHQLQIFVNILIEFECLLSTLAMLLILQQVIIENCTLS